MGTSTPQSTAKMRCDAMRCAAGQGSGYEFKLRQIVGVSRISLLHLNKVGGLTQALLVLLF